MGIDGTGISGDRDFPETAWSLIRHAKDPGSPEYARHLQRLVELYWRPVYFVIRYSWAKTDDDARDLAQEFFTTVIFDWELLRTYVPERGSFRGLMRAALTSFMRNTVRDAGRKKRGGGVPTLSLDDPHDNLSDAIPDAAALTPDQIFDVAWNQVVMGRAVAMLEKQLVNEGKAPAFAVFRRYDLEGDSATLSYGALGTEMGMSVPQIKHALGHARALFRDIVTEVVRGYVDGPEELAAELRSLFGG